MATIGANQVSYDAFRAPKTFKLLGILIAIGSAITFILGIVDVAVTFGTYVSGTLCSGSTSAYCLQSNLVYTWVAVGIWASIPIFITGVLAAYLADHPNKTKKWFTMLAFVSAIIFAPVMIVMSSIEAAMANGIYYNSTTRNDLEKLIIPVIIACIGFLLLIMTFILMIRMCCCTEDPIAKRSANSIFPKAVSTTTPAVNPIAVSTTTPCVHPQVVSPTPLGPYQGPVTVIFPSSATPMSPYNQTYQTPCYSCGNSNSNNYSSSVFVPASTGFGKPSISFGQTTASNLPQLVYGSAVTQPYYPA